jgi:ketosteroid isomerase-like protein
VTRSRNSSFVLGLRDGKIATFKGYLDRAKALAAAGLT